MNVMDEEQSVLRWGGLAGMLGSVLLVVVFVFVGVVVGDAATAAVWVDRFPDIRAARTFENGAFLVVLIVWVPHFLALYRALRQERLVAPALFGSVLGIVGLAVLAAEALPHVAQAPLADLYHAPGTTPEEQATLILIWQATQGILDAMLVAGLAIVPIGIVCLGAAMLGAPAFGRGVGGASVALGALGAGAAVLLLIDPGSVPGALAGTLALLVFHFVSGWRVYRLAKAP